MPEYRHSRSGSLNIHGGAHANGASASAAAAAAPGAGSGANAASGRAGFDGPRSPPSESFPAPFAQPSGFLLLAQSSRLLSDTSDIATTLYLPLLLPLPLPMLCLPITSFHSIMSFTQPVPRLISVLPLQRHLPRSLQVLPTRCLSSRQCLPLQPRSRNRRRDRLQIFRQG
jgi:hypothetical protein